MFGEVFFNFFSRSVSTFLHEGSFKDSPRVKELVFPKDEFGGTLRQGTPNGRWGGLWTDGKTAPKGLLDGFWTFDALATGLGRPRGGREQAPGESREVPRGVQNCPTDNRMSESRSSPPRTPDRV
jgi:hypothetical protein